MTQLQQTTDSLVSIKRKSIINCGGRCFPEQCHSTHFKKRESYIFFMLSHYDCIIYLPK